MGRRSFFTTSWHEFMSHISPFIHPSTYNSIFISPGLGSKESLYLHVISSTGISTYHHASTHQANLPPSCRSGWIWFKQHAAVPWRHKFATCTYTCVWTLHYFTYKGMHLYVKKALFTYRCTQGALVCEQCFLGIVFTTYGSLISACTFVRI